MLFLGVLLSVSIMLTGGAFAGSSDEASYENMHFTAFMSNGKDSTSNSATVPREETSNRPRRQLVHPSGTACKIYQNLTVGRNIINQLDAWSDLSTPLECGSAGSSVGQPVLAVGFIAPVAGVYAFRTVRSDTFSNTVLQLRNGSTCDGQSLICANDGIHPDSALSYAPITLDQGQAITVIIAGFARAYPGMQTFGTTEITVEGPLSCSPSSDLRSLEGSGNGIGHYVSYMTRVVRELQCSTVTDWPTLGRPALRAKITARLTGLYTFVLSYYSDMYDGYLEIQKGDGSCVGEVVFCGEFGHWTSQQTLLVAGETYTVFVVSRISRHPGISDMTVGGYTTISIYSPPWPTPSVSPSAAPSVGPSSTPSLSPSTPVPSASPITGLPSTSPSNRPSILLTLPPAAMLCGPSPALRARKQCLKRIKLCSRRFGVWMKWKPGCGNGDGGCQCAAYCGYTCAKACSRDRACFWNGSRCLSKATNQPGAVIPQCVY